MGTVGISLIYAIDAFRRGTCIVGERHNGFCTVGIQRLDHMGGPLALRLRQVDAYLANMDVKWPEVCLTETEEVTS